MRSHIEVAWCSLSLIGYLFPSCIFAVVDWGHPLKLPAWVFLYFKYCSLVTSETTLICCLIIPLPPWIIIYLMFILLVFSDITHSSYPVVTFPTWILLYSIHSLMLFSDTVASSKIDVVFRLRTKMRSSSIFKHIEVFFHISSCWRKGWFSFCNILLGQNTVTYRQSAS